MKIAIIGGGFTGLTAAYELTKHGHRVVLFEKEKILGGLAHGFIRGNWQWHVEYGYHHLFTNDWSMRELIEELGLQNLLLVKRPITANYWKGRIYQFDSPLHLLSFPGLPLADKLRTGLLAAFCKAYPFWQTLEGFTAKELFTTIGGNRAWDMIWEPLMVGKFGNYDHSIAASWLWARIKKRTPNLAYIQGGFHTLVSTLEKKIKEQHGVIHTGVAIKKIVKNHAKFRILHSHFDSVLLTVPTPVITKLIPELKNSLKEALTIPHLHAQTLILETKEPILHDVYWLSIIDRSFPFLAVVAHTNFMDKKFYGGRHLTYFGNYLPSGHKYLSMTKEQLLKEFLPFIKRLNSILNSKFLILNSYMFVGPFAQPIHQRNYSKVAPKLETPVPGLYIANIDSIYPWDRGTNYAVELGIKASRRIAGS